MLGLDDAVQLLDETSQEETATNVALTAGVKRVANQKALEAAR